MIRGRALAVLAVLSLPLVSLPDAAWARSKKKTAIEKVGKKAAELFVKAPADQEVCFAPDEPCEAKLVKFLESATSSIDVAIFDINLDQFVHTLLVKSKQLPVRVLVDRRQAKGKNSLVRTLLKGGIAVKFGRQRGIMHNKFTLVDGARLETGSFNYTHGAAGSNQENQLYLFNPAVVERYRAQFERMWKEGLPVAGDSWQ